MSGTKQLHIHCWFVDPQIAHWEHWHGCPVLSCRCVEALEKQEKDAQKEFEKGTKACGKFGRASLQAVDKLSQIQY